MMTPSKMGGGSARGTRGLTPSLSSTATQGDPHDHHRCPCYAAGCPHRRHSDLDRAATVELRRRHLSHHRRPRWIERHLSFHPLTAAALSSICALASVPAAVIIRGRAHPSSWFHGHIDV